MNDEEVRGQVRRRPAVVQNSCPEDEQLLVEAARQGSAEAFEMLYFSNKSRVDVLVRQLAAPHLDREQLVQDTFLQAFCQLETLRDPARFQPWLRTIARNAVRDEMRREGRKPRLAPLDPELPSRMPDPFRRALYREKMSRLGSLLREHSIRPALVRAMALGLTDREISRKLRCSVGAIKSQKFRLRQTLARALQPAPSRRRIARHSAG